MIVLQRIDPQTGLGFWINPVARWWEDDPVLASSYALVTLSIVLRPAVGS